MNRAISTFRPNSNWLSISLLTLFVLSFGVFAESRVDDGTVMMAETSGTVCDRGITHWLSQFSWSEARTSKPLSFVLTQ
ncbi:MAG: hypothetical protein ABGY96_23070 [bacterium]|nr:hypothetical protein [Gammaproteobacteria bacterium]HIL98293.1 hypothetical protein [Pseudomonadales bacterium]